MINALKKQLLQNPKHIENILIKFNFYNIKIHSKEIRCGLDDGTNTTSIRVKLNDNLSASDYSRNVYGDLISIIIRLKNVSFQEVIATIKNELGISETFYFKQDSIFGGFYSKIRSRKNDNSTCKIYSEEILNDYKDKLNLRFLQDGVDLLTQKKFKIGLDVFSQRISIPWYDIDGNLIGVMGRANFNHELEDIAKYLPLIPFQKSTTLYGYSENYMAIKETQICILSESEKGVLQLNSMGYQTGLGVGCHSVSPRQCKIIHTLNLNKLIIAFDEGLEEETIKQQCQNIKLFNKYSSMEIYYIFDRENKYLPKGSKSSPMDLGKAVFDLLLKECLIKWEVA